MDLRTQKPVFLEGVLPEGVSRYPSDEIELYIWDRFLLPSECRSLIHEIGDSFTQSITMIKDLQSLRSSKTSLIYPKPGSVAAKLEAKILKMTGYELECSDLLQAQAYEKGGEYKDHYDFFVAGAPGYEEAMADGGQRTWTFMMYLNTVKEGGGTAFPNIDAVITPRAGRALFWNNLTPTGSLNGATLHAGLSVKKGRKLIITKWFREAPRWAQSVVNRRDPGAALRA